MDADPDQLVVAADAVADVLGRISEDQWTLPTPCTDWTVRDLLHHLVTGNEGFAAALRGEGWPAPRAVDPPERLVRAYRESVARLVDAFRQPGALVRTVTVPFGTVPGAVALHLRITELLAHGWDLARACGQTVSFPDELAEQELAFTRPALAQIPPERSPFAPPEPVADDAPAIDRLVACLGRKVTAPTS